jgi:hypothetical protein
MLRAQHKKTVFQSSIPRIREKVFHLGTEPLKLGINVWLRAWCMPGDVSALFWFSLAKLRRHHGRRGRVR